VAKKEAALGRKTGMTAMARLGVPSRNRGTQRHGWGARASAVVGARVRAWVRAGVHGRWNLPDASLGSGLTARRRVGATRSGVQAITDGLTAVASLATNTRKDGAARLWRTTTPWSAVERARPWPRTASARKPVHWGVRRRRGRRTQRRSEQGKNKRGARALVKVAAPAREFPTRHKDRPHMAASEAARERSG
jgi:hypothetical protein